MRIEHLTPEESAQLARILPDSLKGLEFLRLRDVDTTQYKLTQVVRVGAGNEECVVFAINHNRGFVTVAVVPAP